MTKPGHRLPSSRSIGVALLAVLIAVLTLLAPAPASAQRLAEFLDAVEPQTVVPGADRFGAVSGSPPVAPALAGDQVVGSVFLNSDFVDSTGYSGKPIHIVTGLEPQGRITGVALVEHQEPIVLIGISETRVVDAIQSRVGADVAEVAAGREPLPQVDIVSGATATVLVMGDSVLRASIAVVRQGSLATAQPGAAAPADAPERSIVEGPGEERSWQALLGDGSVRRLSISVGEVNAAFERTGIDEAIERPERGDPDETFIDLYTGSRRSRRSAARCSATRPTSRCGLGSSPASTRSS